MILAAPVSLHAAPRATSDSSLREIIRRDVARRATLARKAWTEQRPELLIEPGPDTLVVVRTPDGRARTRGDLVEDLRRRMAMVTRIDTLREEVDSIRTMADSAVVFTSQRFVR